LSFEDYLKELIEKSRSMRSYNLLNLNERN